MKKRLVFLILPTLMVILFFTGINYLKDQKKSEYDSWSKVQEKVNLSDSTWYFEPHKYPSRTVVDVVIVIDRKEIEKSN